MSALNCTNPKIQRLSTVSSVVAAAGHVFSTRWHWFWQDESNKWQSYDTPTDGHAASTTSSQCLEREYMAGQKTILHPSPLCYGIIQPTEKYQKLSLKSTNLINYTSSDNYNLGATLAQYNLTTNYLEPIINLQSPLTQTHSRHCYHQTSWSHQE